MKKIFNLYIFLFATIAYAQDDLVFKVLFNKGANTIDNSKAIVTGTKILKGQTIHMVEGGYIGMIYKTGKSIELKKAGVHSVNDLEKGVLTSSASFSAKYRDLVMNEMSKSSEGLTANRKVKMNVTGSVERGTEAGLSLISPKNSEHLSSDVKLMWLKDTTAKNGYVVKVKDMFDEPLKSYEVKDTSITINVNELNLKTSKSFIITVEVKNSKVMATEGKLVKVIDGKKAEVSLLSPKSPAPCFLRTPITVNFFPYKRMF